MPPSNVELLALNDVRLALPVRYQRIAPVAADLPVFDDAGVAALERGETSQSKDQRKWRSLPFWLDDVGSDPSKATVLCRRTALTITVDARVPPDLPADVHLLPLAEEPTAHLAWTTPAGEVLQQPLAAMLDVTRRKLTLMLKFPDDQAGPELYGKIVETLSAASVNPAAVVSAVHTFVRSVAAPTRPTGPIRPIDVPQRITQGGIVGAQFRIQRPLAQDLRLTANIRAVDVPGEPTQPDAAAIEHVAVAAQPLQARAMDVARLPIEPAMMLRVNSPVRADLIYRPPQLPETQKNVSLAAQARFPIQRRREDVTVFPDLPRQARNGWDQIPNRPPNLPPLHFRDSDEIASFFYLPTRFKLGYGVDNEGAGLPPMRAEAFRDEQGNPKVKVTLVALPSIDEADRELIRMYLRDTVLVSQVPFVRLSPAAGLEAQFNPDFTAGSATDATGLPATIRFEPLELAPEKWLIVKFTMAASDYPIFGAMLRKGLRGRVALTALGVHSSVPVSLELEDVMTDGLRVRPDAARPNDVTVENLLNLSTTLSSVRASLLDTGPSGLIFAAEEHILLPQAQTVASVAAKGNWTATIEPRSISGWDSIIVALGPVRVEGGTADDWLNAVNRDSSFQPQPFRVGVELTIPSAGADRVELVQLRLFKQGDTAPRQEIRIVPGSPPVDLLVNMTLEELMGREGQAMMFFVEYETLHKDQTFSMPQRMLVNLADRSMLLVALVEAPGCLYMVDYRDGTGAHRPEQDRDATANLVDRLRGEGRMWQIYARRPETPPVTPPVTPP